MKFYIEKEKLSKHKELESIVCDWCKTAFKASEQNEDAIDIENKFDNTKSGYEVNEFTLKWKVGNNYPDGGCGEEEFVELCSECREKLKKLLLDNGIVIQKRDWDY